MKTVLERLARLFCVQRDKKGPAPAQNASPGAGRPAATAAAPLPELFSQYFAYIDHARQSAQSRGADFFFCAYPKVMLLQQPSETERILERTVFSPSDRREDNYVGDRIAWLKSNPPWLKAVFSAVADFSDEYARAVFTGPDCRTTADNLMVQQDMASRYVNVKDGFRVTTGVPETCARTVHVFGASTAYGFGCEDAHTIPSLLQAHINDLARQDDSFAPVRVLNYGIRGGSYAMSIAHLLKARVEPGDVVLLLDCSGDNPLRFDDFHNQSILALPRLCDLCTSKGIPSINLQPLFERPHPHGEVFFDALHMGYGGHKVVAERLFELCLRMDHLHRKSAANLAAALRLDLLPAVNKAAEDQVLKTPEAQAYLKLLKQQRTPDGIIGAVLMNSNPFTLGHRHLVGHAASQVEHLFVFVVSEDTQFFNFQDRFEMVQLGTAEFPNVTVLPYASFQATAATHPEYFDKERNPDARLDATSDLAIFGRHLAPVLRISRRYFGCEPLCPVTRQYNQQMHETLPKFGIQTQEIPRHELDGKVVSASTVRRLLKEGDWPALRGLVPETTYQHLVRTGRVPSGPR